MAHHLDNKNGNQYNGDGRFDEITNEANKDNKTIFERFIAGNINIKSKDG